MPARASLGPVTLSDMSQGRDSIFLPAYRQRQRTGEAMTDRERAVALLLRRARESDSAMVRVLSASEIEWLVEPLLPVSLAEAKTA